MSAPSTSPALAAPVVTSRGVLFRLADPGRSIVRVRLVHELFRPRVGPEFTRVPRSRAWELHLPRPDVDRMEYRLALTYAGGREEIVCDPGNPLRAPGPFGDKSVVEFPGYRPPGWLDGEDVARGVRRRVEIWSPALRAHVPVVLSRHAPVPGTETCLPLLVVHDGPQYAAYSALLDFLEASVAAGRLPPLRAALLAPVDRDETYSASAVYARALVRDLLPALRTLQPRANAPVVAMGASLGALALLHAHRLYPATFGALFLQSGSFFRQRSDPQEAGFGRCRRISRFVGQVLAEQVWDDTIPVTLTCGTVEENLANNRAVRDALVAQGYDVRFHEQRDAHNWIAWRDTFDPHLAELLRRAWP